MSIFTKQQTEAPDLGTLTARAQAIIRSRDEQLRQVYGRDTEFQHRRYAAGGSMTSELTEEGQAAANRVTHQADRDLASLGAANRASIEKQHDAMLAEAATAFEAALAALRKFEPFEGAMGQVFHLTKQPQRRTAWDPDLALTLTGFLQRVASIATPSKPAAPRASQHVPMRPDFSDLVRQ